MISSWMLYACLVAGLVSVAAVALERAAFARRWPTRFIWIGAVIFSIAWPLANAVRGLMPAGTRRVVVVPFTITVEPERIIAGGSIAPGRAVLIDRGLVVLWVGFSALLLIRLSAGVASLQRTRRAWKRGQIDGTAVRLSDNVGPAVVGLRSMDVVVPEWIMTLDAPLRAIVLRHEEEHRTARDPYLLFTAAVAVVLMPWNLALWMQARRLRLAIELDCDARVLRAHPSAERYGLLMLTIAQRRSVAPTLFAPMLTEPTTHLERRIIAMRATTTQLGKWTAYAMAAVAAAALAMACSLQAGGKTSAVPVTSRLLNAGSIPLARVADESRAASPQTPNPTPRYPDMLRTAEIEGTVTVQWTTDASGVADMSSFKVISSTHDLFTNAVRNVLPRWRSKPNTQYEVPFVFVLSHLTGAASFDAPPNAVIIMANPVSQAGSPATGAPQQVSDNQTYFEFQVERAVKPRPDNQAPRYPDALRAAHIEGEVLAQFVMDTTGVPIPGTLKILKSSHELFTEAVRTALPDMLFYPADVGGRPVKQLVQMPFQFTLTKDEKQP